MISNFIKFFQFYNSHSNEYSNDNFTSILLPVNANVFQKICSLKVILILEKMNHQMPVKHHIRHNVE